MNVGGLTEEESVGAGVRADEKRDHHPCRRAVLSGRSFGACRYGGRGRGGLLPVGDPSLCQRGALADHSAMEQ